MQCGGHGHCEDGLCVCDPGYASSFCNYYLPLMEADTVYNGYVEGDGYANYQINPSSETNLQLSLKTITTNSANCAMKVRAEDYPTQDIFNYQATYNDAPILIENPQNINWKIQIYSIDGSPCDYSLEVQFTDECENNCYGHGVCNQTIGRCICDNYHVGDSCKYPLLLLTNTLTTRTALFVNDWVYYKFTATKNFTVLVKENFEPGDVWVFVSEGTFPTLESYEWTDKDDTVPEEEQGVFLEDTLHYLHVVFDEEGDQTFYIGLYCTPAADDGEAGHLQVSVAAYYPPL